MIGHKWILRTLDGSVWSGVDSYGSGQASVKGFARHGNKHTDSIKCRKYLDQAGNL